MLAERAPLPDIVTGPAVFFGDDACLTVALLAGLRGTRPGRPLLIVDGANAFDPFLVADLARKSGIAPQILLDQIRISRVFTVDRSDFEVYRLKKRGRFTILP